MNTLKYISFILIFFLFNSCMVEREEENSFYLNQIDRIQIATPLTLFFSENLQRDLNLSIRFFDRNNRPLFDNRPIPYDLLLTDSIINQPTLDLSRKGTYQMRAAFPTKEKVFSNNIEVRVVGPEYIREVVLDFAATTRNSHIVKGIGNLDFTIKVFGPEGEITGLEDQIFRNLELQVGNQKNDRLNNISVEQLGILDAKAKVFGVESNTLKIDSREDKILPVYEMPIIFHVFSNGPKISPSEMNDQIMKSNFAFNNSLRTSFRRNLNSVNSYFRFRLADKDPEGNPLPVLGYNVITVSNDFSQNSSDYDLVKFNAIWDPNRYINVFIDNIGFAAGYAYLPDIPDNSIPGLFVNTDQVFDFPYSITLDYNFAIKDNNPNPYTLAHELGHFLGLYHTFDNCDVGDYCEDTPPHLLQGSQIERFSNNKSTCDGKSFISTNIMDYLRDVDHFTFDQRERMRAVYDIALFFPRVENQQSSRLTPIKKGELNPDVKPIICQF
ncbi:M43 family zinc metalloprotease [Shivajiella indica]|uniref:M43 family zinc metalloprotease n=1 Tax=Shivajiella indica TaxID=872115 RepID=A0ABW5B707_9BACT